MSNDLGGNALQELFAQYPLHHVTYSATKFEVAMSSSLGGDTFTRNVTDRRMESMDRLLYKINIPFFSKDKGRYNNSGFWKF